jgi:predicted nucleic acid-binding Zn ribbon protein
MASRRFDGPQRISDSLGALIKRFSRTDLIGIAALEDHWAELVGTEVADHSRPSALRGSTLVVVVDQPAWATQVRLVTGSLLERFSQVSGQRVERIEMTVRR